MANDTPAFEPLDDDPFANLDPLQREQLDSYRKAFEAEFTDTSSAAKAETTVEELADVGLDRLEHIIKHSPNETLVARVSMWAVDKRLERDSRKEEGIYQFLEGLEANRTENKT